MSRVTSLTEETADRAFVEAERIEGEWYWRRGGKARLSMRQIWLIHPERDATRAALMVCELVPVYGSRSMKPYKNWRELEPVAQINGLDAAALALANQIAAEPLDSYSRTAEACELRWRRTAKKYRPAVPLIQELWATCSEEEVTEWANSVLFPVHGCGDASVAIGERSGNGWTWQVLCRPAVKVETKSGLQANYQPQELDGIGDGAGEAQTAGRESYDGLYV